MRKRYATFDWLQKQEIAGLSHADRSRLYKFGVMPDLQGKEILALAMRAHGHGQKAIGKAISVRSAVYRAFLNRLGLPSAQSEQIQAAKRAEKTKQAHERAATRRREREQTRQPTRNEFIGPRIPFYWRNIQKSREHGRLKSRRIYWEKKHLVEFTLPRRVRTRIYNALRRNQLTIKAGKTAELLGCDLKALRKHLESLWLPGMDWNNYGQWHIDHIIPIASFDLNRVEQQLKAFHYSNLQPLWGIDNLVKNSRMPNGTLIRKNKMSA